MEAYSDEIDLREYVGVLWRWRWLIVVVTLIATTTAGLLSFFVLEPVYEASAQMMVPKDPLPAEIITSPNFMQMIIEELGLQDKYDAFTLARAVSLETSKVSASLTTVRVQGSDPALNARIANQIAADFLEFVKSKHVQAMSASVSYFAGQKAEADANLVSVQRELADLRQSTRIEALQLEVNRLEGQVLGFRSQLASSEMREQELITGVEELSRTLETTPKVLAGPPDWSGHATEVPNETYQRFDQALTMKKVELSELRVRLENIRTSLPALKAEYDTRYTALLTFQQQLRELEARESVLEEQIASFSNRINELTANLPQTNVVSPAVVPIKPIKPQKLMNMVVATVLGGFLSVLMVFGIEYWRSPRKTATLTQ